MPRKFILLSVAVLIFIISLIGFLVPADSGKGGIADAQSFFDEEEDYIEHIQKEVRFEDLHLDIVEIKMGDNFWRIARDHGVGIDTLIGANPFWENLMASFRQRIVVPSVRGVLHFVNDFTEMEELAAVYGAKKSDILVERLPALYRYYYRFLGDRKPIAVFIKGAKPTAINMTDQLAAQFRVREMFRSPLGGRFSSFFGGRRHPIFRYHHFHNGLDIATPHGTPVGAACGGRVTAAGWMGGYGKAVIISHPNGFRTLYGHLSRISVSKGQRVEAGRIIGRAGSTGNSTGPHLHFTLWRNGKLINPMKVLW